MGTCRTASPGPRAGKRRHSSGDDDATKGNFSRQPGHFSSVPFQRSACDLSSESLFMRSFIPQGVAGSQLTFTLGRVTLTMCCASQSRP